MYIHIRTHIYKKGISKKGRKDSISEIIKGIIEENIFELKRKTTC